MKLLLALVLLKLAPNSAYLRRKTIVVGKNDCPPGQEGCAPRGNDYVPCSEALDEDGNYLFKGQNKDPCGSNADANDVECTWYPGFSEYYCECDGTKSTTDYCTPENAFCLTDYEFTKIFPTDGRTFWNCD
eukprot:112444_1